MKIILEKPLRNPEKRIHNILITYKPDFRKKEVISINKKENERLFFAKIIKIKPTLNNDSFIIRFKRIKEIPHKLKVKLAQI